MVRRAVITGCLLLVALVGVGLLRAFAGSRPAGSADVLAAGPRFEPVRVQDEAVAGLTLEGEITDLRGAPIAQAEVSLAATSQQSIASVTCADGLPLLFCPARPSAQVLAGMLERSEGTLQPGATTRTDERGHFRFEHLVGVSFTVWAQAPGFGVAVRARAAPGESVRLVLPPARAVRGELEDELGHPIPGAAVWAISRRAALPQRTRSDPRGRFEIPGLGEGPFELVATAPGFLPRVVREVEAAGPGAEGESGGVRILLLRPRTLEVRVVVDGRGDGQDPEALVRLEGDHLSRQARTRGGVARFEQLDPEPVVISAEAGALASSPRTLTLAQEVTRVELRLEAAGALLVTPVDETGGPIANPTVTLLTTFDEPLQSARPQAGALATLGPLALGEYHLKVAAEGFQTAELPVRVKAGRTAVEVGLLRGISVSGRVLDEYGRPLPEVAVFIEPTRQSAVTDAQGRFTALVPSVGAYSLEVQHSLWGGTRKAVQAPASGVELQLEPRASAEVRVTAGGVPLEGASVSLVAEGGADGPGAAYRSDQPSGSDGRVLMRGLEAGTYRMVAEHPRLLPSAPQTVVLTEGTAVRLEVELRDGAAIRGQVVDQAQRPIPGATIAAGAAARQATSDAEGRFELLPLQQGERYRLEARAPLYELAEPVEATAGGPVVTLVLQEKAKVEGRVVGDDGQPVQRFEVEGETFSSSDGRFEAHVSRGGERVSFVVSAPGFEPEVVDQAQGGDVGTVTLHRSPQLSGVVREPGGAGVEGAVVSCNACDDAVTTDEAGRFTLSHPGGVGELSVTARKGRLSGTAKLEAGRELTERALVIELPPLVRLSGRAYLPDGRPAAGRAIEAFDADRSELVTIVTGADGAYQVELPGGSYRIPVNPGEATVGVPLEFVSVQGSEVHLDLGPAPGTGTLTVHLQPEPGKALWIVPGAPPISDPPVDLFKLPFGQLVYQPSGSTVVVQGLPPGRYTVVWANQHMETPGGPEVRVIDVSGQQELSLLAP